MAVQYKKMKEMYSETGKIEQNILDRLIRTDPFGNRDCVGPYAVSIGILDEANVEAKCETREVA